MTRGRQAVAWLVSLALTVGVVILSRAPMAAEQGDHAVLRLTWSARPERIEICRTPSAEELAEIPAHMRQTRICEGRAARYLLVVTADGMPVLEDTLTGGGARADRLVYLLREIPFAPGAHRIRVSQEILDAPEIEAPGEGSDTLPAMALDRETRERQEAVRRRREAVPRALAWEGMIEFGSRQVVLVTYDPLQRRLVSVTDPGSR